MNYTDKLQNLENRQAARFSYCVDRVRHLGATIIAQDNGIVKYFTNVYDASFYFDVEEKVILEVLDKPLTFQGFMINTLKPNKDGSPYMPDTPAYRYSKPVVVRATN